MSGIKARELELKINKRSNANLFVKGKTVKRDFQSNNSSSSKKFSKKKSFEKKNNKASQSKNWNTDKEERKCFHCGKPGHIRRNCWFLKGKDQNQNNTNNVTNKSAFTSSCISEVLNVNDFDHSCYSEVLNVSKCIADNDWILDSGCSFHMCPNLDWFVDFNEVHKSPVYMGDNNICMIHGIGNIPLKLNDGSVILLTKVRYIPNLKRNLISLSMLDETGCTYSAANGCLVVCKNNKPVLKGIKSHGLYVLCGSYYSENNKAAANELIIALISAKLHSAEKWHLRLGHMSQQGLKALGNQGILNYNTTPMSDFCETCILGKQTRLTFHKGTHLAKECLEYVHADLWGPSRVVTPGGNRYFLSIVDDFSRSVWVYLLKSKDQTLDKFKDWKNLVENQMNKRVKILRTDNGLEFCNILFDDYCRINGIQRHKTVINTPQQNGIAERMNRTLLEKVRCLMITSNLPKYFWGEALNTAAYLINRSPSTVLNFKCPAEIWNNRPPNLDHLRIFGCSAFMHKSEGKLDPRSAKCVFLGYQEGTKGYRLWDKNTPGFKVVISRDVIFNEVEFPCRADNVVSEFFDDIVSADLTSAEQTKSNKTSHIEVEHASSVDRDGSNATSQEEEGITATHQTENGNSSPEPNTEATAPIADNVDVPAESIQSDLENYQLVRDRNKRIPKPNSR
ncbi:hypothetical protein Dimus_037947 [Dionaea muscipula]